MPVFLFAFFLTSSPSAQATNSERRGTLEDYLKQLGYEAIEFERTDHGQDFVTGFLANGHKPRLLVDTGWGITSLNPGTARGLKALNEAEAKRYRALFRPGTNTVVLMDELKLGGIQLLNQPARVEEFRVDYVPVPFDGVLGCDFFFRNYCLIDCYKHRLYVRKAKPSLDERKALEGTLQLSGFDNASLEETYLLSTVVQINGKPVRLGVDTGAPYDEIDDSEVSPLGLKLLKYSQPSTGSLIPNDLSANVIGMGKIGRHAVHFTRVSTFQLGPRPWKNFDIGVSDLKDWGLAKPGTRGEAVKGLLSLLSLERQGTLIDVAGSKLWFRPEKPASR
jgi:predicted aspartyl protease